MTKNSGKLERGNALFLILIAVALFAALAYAVTQSGKGSGSVSKEKLALNSARLIQAGSALKAAATRMLLVGGCTVSSMDVTTVPSSASYNTAPTGCKLFHKDGGGAALPPADLLGFDGANIDEFSGILPSPFVGVFVWPGVGTASGQDVVFFYQVSERVCQEINKKLTGSSTIPTMDLLFHMGDLGVDITTGYPAGTETGCIRNDVFADYEFFQILVAQ